MAATLEKSTTVRQDTILGLAQCSSLPAVSDADPCPFGGQEPADRLPGPAEADNRCRVTWRYVNRTAHYLNFKVARARKPRMIETIQNRTTTLVSCQPFFSK